MGMDSYIYKNSKENYERFLENEKIEIDNTNRWDEFIRGISTKYNCEIDKLDRPFFAQTCTKEEQDTLEKFIVEKK